MMGFVIDPWDGASFVWGNDPTVKQYRELIKFNLNQQVKEMEHTFGCVHLLGNGHARISLSHRAIEMRERGMAVPLPLKSLVTNPGEGQRDQGRKLLGRLLANQLCEFCARLRSVTSIY